MATMHATRNVFQLTTSHRGRLTYAWKLLILSIFQLTTSHRGRRRPAWNYLYTTYYFNSLPHTEVDVFFTAFNFIANKFQLTTSHRGRHFLHNFKSMCIPYFNSLPHTEVDSNLSQNSERTSMNHITNRTINLYFFISSIV